MHGHDLNKCAIQDKTKFEAMSRAEDMLVMLAAKLSDNQKDAAMYKYTDMVTECVYRGKMCKSSVFNIQ